ncbi:MAG: transposase, partial [Deltaproteobacteria bacterium]|nr:transposase [Deltaproteobacteria bacterium]
MPQDKPKDVLTEVLREGCQDILRSALEFEIAEFLDGYKELRTSEGRQRITRNGHHRPRPIQTGVGDVIARVPRAWDQQEG